MKYKRLWKIHDLVELAKKVKAPQNILELCDALNPHYIETRYLIDVNYDKDMSKEALDNARKVVLWAKKNNEEIIRKIENFKQRIGVDKIIIFGSFARGEFGKDSDIDLILVDEGFEGKEFHKRTKGFWLKWDLGIPVDFICYTPEEFNKLKKRVSIVSEALKEGIAI